MVHRVVTATGEVGTIDGGDEPPGPVDPRGPADPSGPVEPPGPPDPEPTHRWRRAVVVLVLLTVIVLTVLLLLGEGPVRQAAAPSTLPPPTTAPGLADAIPAVHSIIVKLPDLPKSFVSDGAELDQSVPTQLGTPCTPVSGQQWRANALANFGSATERQGITANVWQMQSPAVAQSAVSAFLDPAFGPGCQLPLDDAEDKRNDFSAAPTAQCPAPTFISSRIERLPPPQEGWAYVALNGCTTSKTSHTFVAHHDTALAAVGPFVMQIDSTGAPSSTLLSQRLVALMESRATAIVDGKVRPTRP